MVYRAPRSSPLSRLAEERRGALVGRFCHGCNQVFPLQRRLHTGDPIYGRDHVASTCPYEGWAFEAGADWWEPAVEVLRPVAAASPGAAPAGAPTPPAGTPPAGGGAIAPPPAQPATGSAPQQGQAAPAPVQPPPKP